MFVDPACSHIAAKRSDLPPLSVTLKVHQIYGMYIKIDTLFIKKYFQFQILNTLICNFRIIMFL